MERCQTFSRTKSLGISFQIGFLIKAISCTFALPNSLDYELESNSDLEIGKVVPFICKFFDTCGRLSIGYLIESVAPVIVICS